MFVFVDKLWVKWVILILVGLIKWVKYWVVVFLFKEVLVVMIIFWIFLCVLRCFKRFFKLMFWGFVFLFGDIVLCKMW